MFGRCERHALLHMAPKWFDHWTTGAGLHTQEPYRATATDCSTEEDYDAIHDIVTGYSACVYTVEIFMTRPITLLLNRPVDRRKLSALYRPIDRKNYNI